MSSIPEKPGLNPDLQNNMSTTPTSTFFYKTHQNKLQLLGSKPDRILMTSPSWTLNPTDTTLQRSYNLPVSHSFPH